MTVLVLGGGGFIGQWVVKALLARGESVLVMGRTPSAIGMPPDARYICAEYGDVEILDRVLTAVDAVIHLAYATVPSTSFSNPIHDLVANVPSSVTLFEQAARAGIKRLVFVSSGGTVYGNVTVLPIEEDAPTNPISPYGITKLTIERYAQMHFLLDGLPVVIARPGNAYGLRCDGTPGPGFVTAAVRGVALNQPVPVYGDGGTIRDYVYVSDVAEGILACMYEGELGHIYNIGTGSGLSNMEVIAAAARCAGKRPEQVAVQFQPDRGFDVRANVLSPIRLESVSRWRHRVSMDQGIGELQQAFVVR
jgi:UDP-glucose 4-epimerase